MRDAIFRLTLGVYYLALGTWFGATGMMGAAAGLTFVTLRAADPVLPGGPAGNPELAPFTADFLAGNAVNAAFWALTIIQLGCVLVVVAAAALQAVFWRDRQVNHGRTWANGLRLAAILLAVVLFAGDLLVTRSDMTMLRGEMYTASVTEEDHRALHEDFRALHQRSARTQLGAAGLMAAAALLSPFVLHRSPTRHAKGTRRWMRPACVSRSVRPPSSSGCGG